MIAHSLMDSIVDAFMPLINSIELEVKNVDDLVTGVGADPLEGHPQASDDYLPAPSPHWLGRPLGGWASHMSRSPGEKLENKELGGPLPASSTKHSAYTIKRWCQRAPLNAITRLVRFEDLRRRRKLSSLMQTLLRMSRTRRRVVHLARLLGSKNEIIGRLRKRLIPGELAAQLGDVQGIPSIAIIALESR
jgi:magnesium transporter